MVLAGLETVDSIFTDFANALEVIIRSGRSRTLLSFFYLHSHSFPLVDLRKKAVEVALSITSGAYQTSLVSYFTHRDLFPALMKVSSIPPRLFSSFTYP